MVSDMSLFTPDVLIQYMEDFLRALLNDPHVLEVLTNFRDSKKREICAQ